MDHSTLTALEFHTLKELIAPFIRTPPGREALDRLEPEGDEEELRSRKRLADEAMRYCGEEERLGPGNMGDPAPVIEQLRPEGATLEASEVRRLVGVMMAADSLRIVILRTKDRFPLLAGLASGIPDMRNTTRMIDGRITTDGTLDDEASPELSRVRKKIATLEGRLQRSLSSILDKTGKDGVLQDSYISVRNGRFVIPVRAESRSSVPGIVHGVSSTGATLFIEPIATLDLNNDLVTVREKESTEVRRILSEWSSMLRSRLPEIRKACRLIAELDLLGGVGRFGAEYRCVIADEAPAGGDKVLPELKLMEARHPVLENGLREKGERPVPLDLKMQAHGGALILSGPNAGGKTVALKTIGLLSLMNQAGLPVPARQAVLPVYRQIIADIGDHQSIMDSLSTFSARMKRVAGMLEGLEVPALVLLDEIGAGTDPEEAGALAVAILDRFRRAEASVVATTHHEALKAYAETTQGAVNAAMEIDEETMIPTYHLLSGVAGASGGVDLAARVGLPAEVVEDARQRLSAGHRETKEYLQKLRDTADTRERELARMREEHERERTRFQKMEKGLRGEAESLRERWRSAIGEALERIDKAREDFIARIKERTIALQLRAESRRETKSLRDSLMNALSEPDNSVGTPISPESDRPVFSTGARVRLDSMGGQVATVESVGTKGVRVMVRGKRMQVPAGSLTLLEEGPESGAPPSLPAGVSLQSSAKGEAPSEINLLGARVEEALERVDKFLDDAFLAGHREVRVVHGHGTGRLRKAMRSFLSEHPHVESHGPADSRSGGEGATTVILRG